MHLLLIKKTICKELEASCLSYNIGKLAIQLQTALRSTFSY